MAELLIIPGLALLGLYSINTQNRGNAPRRGEEGFTGGELPNTNTPDINYPNDYPIQNVNSDVAITSRLSTVNQFDNGGGVYTDKYFNENSFTNPPLAKRGDEGRYQSLTGSQSPDYFSHNNMTPFFGSKSRDTHIKNNANEGLLDSMNGAGSQIITKRETAPLFDAKTNVNWAHNMPSTAEFVRSRMNASKSMNNVSPFEQQRVAPGMGLGAGTEGEGGFNSGMMAREQWIDRSVDELRGATNQKASGFSQLGFEGPAGAYVKNLGSIGNVEKYGPETAFEGYEPGMGRSMGVSSSVKGVGVHGEIIDRFVNRPETDVAYSGIAGPGVGNSGTQLMDGEYMPSNRIELGAEQMGPVASREKHSNVGDFGLKSATAYPNNRATNYNDDYFGIVGQTVGSILAPIMDVLKPNRKNNMVGTLRPCQNPVAKVKNSYILNTNDRTPTTNREMERLYAQNLWAVNSAQHQNSNGYIVANQNPIHNQRDITTGRSSYVGAGSSAYKNAPTYEGEYRQTSNGIREATVSNSGYAPGGNMALFNSDVNVFSNHNREQDVMRGGEYQNAPKISNTLSPDQNLIGRSMGGSYLYDSIQLDRNEKSVMSDILKKNPYAITPLSQI